MYGVMSRGYICPVVPQQVVEDGPVLSGGIAVAPTITATTQVELPSPIIISADEGEG